MAQPPRPAAGWLPGGLGAQRAEHTDISSSLEGHSCSLNDNDRAVPLRQTPLTVPLLSSCQPCPGSERRLYQHNKTDCGEVSYQPASPQPGRRPAGAVHLMAFSSSALFWLLSSPSHLALRPLPIPPSRGEHLALSCPEQHFPPARAAEPMTVPHLPRLQTWALV